MVSKGDEVIINANFIEGDLGEQEFVATVEEVYDDGSMKVKTDDEEMREVFTTGSVPVTEDSLIDIEEL